MADINHEISIHAPLDKVYEAISTAAGLKAWHTAHVEGNTQLNGVIAFNGTDKPVFRWKVVAMEPDKKVVWECIEGPGDSVGTKTFYTLSTTKDKRTLVELSHTSWPHQEGNFRKCNTLWAILLHHLKNYAETGKADPAIK